MASNGKLEARITVPAGGWAFVITEVPSATATITVPAGTYYHSTADSAAEGLASTIQTLIAAATTATTLTGTYTVAIGAGENGTGKYTITATGITSFSIAWTSTDLKALLGFTSTPSGALTYTGESQAQALWISSYGHQKLTGGSDGDDMVSDLQEAVNSAGYCYGVMGQYYRTAQITWPSESFAKTWTKSEATANESFQTFLLDGIWGTAAWGTCLGPIRFHNDASDDTDYGTYSATNMKNYGPRAMQEHWTGRWIINLPTLIEVPGSRLADVVAVEEVIAFPETAADFASLVEDEAITPSYIWPLQELSGSVVDTVASLALAPSGSPIYGTSASGLYDGSGYTSRVAVEFLDGGTAYFGAAASSTMNISGASAAVLMVIRLASAQTVNRGILGKSAGGSSKGWDIRMASGDGVTARVSDGVNPLVTRSSTYNVDDGNWHYVLMRYHHTSQLLELFCDVDTTVSISTSGTSGDFGTADLLRLGDTAAWTGGLFECAYMAAFEGAAAEAIDQAALDLFWADAVGP